MTADGLASHVPGEATGERTPGLPVATIIELCDRLLGEIARRRHCFAWLRAPEAGAEEWLPVDAYYPANRLVVICHAVPGPDDHLFAELVPAHDLRLLALVPASLGADRTAAEAYLRQSLSALGPPPPPAPPEEPVVARALAAISQPPARAVAALSGRPAQAIAALTQPKPAPVAPRRRVGPGEADAARRAARIVGGGKGAAPREPRAAPDRRFPAPGARRMVPRTRSAAAAGTRSAAAAGTRSGAPAAVADQDAAQPARGRGAEALGVLAGLVLAAIVGAEIYYAIGTEALGSGRALLGLGLMLDAGARVLGTLAAERAGRPLWAWGCVIGGSPVVAIFALYRSDGPESVDPAPLAGLVSLLAVGIVVLSVLLGA